MESRPTQRIPNRLQTIHFVALGCPKNQVDSERMVGISQTYGLVVVANPTSADLIVINTCGFILPAKEESIDAVLEMAQYKQSQPQGAGGRCDVLIMAGCLVQRHAEELAQELPEVDYFIGAGDFERFEAIVRIHVSPDAQQPSALLPLLSPWTGIPVEAAPPVKRPVEQHEVNRPVSPAHPSADVLFPARLTIKPPHAIEDKPFPRAIVAPGGSAYLKIAEGCDRSCAFCIIPQLRGRQRSCTTASLVHEARQLVAHGIREINLIAQDTTAYGHEQQPRAHLADLLEALAAIKGLQWIRVLYAYPSAVDDRLIEALANLQQVVPYLDLPIQHADDHVLSRMKRGYDNRTVRRIVERLRERISGLSLRSTLITGHPGESKLAFQQLRDFVAEIAFDHLGVFPFSAEEGTAAATQDGQIPQSIAEERATEIMELQRGISRRKLANLRGHQLEVLIEGPSPESDYLLQGRHAGQAPEVDGVVVVTDCVAQPGELITARVTNTADYDLIATPLQQTASAKD